VMTSDDGDISAMAEFTMTDDRQVGHVSTVYSGAEDVSVVKGDRGDVGTSV